MEKHNPASEKLSVPTDFAAPTVSRNIQKNLIPPSHFTSTVQPSGILRAVQNQATLADSWTNSGLAPAVRVATSPATPWLAITQAQEEITELRMENCRLMALQGDTLRGRSHSTESTAKFVDRGEPWSRLEAEWRLKVETHKAEAERLRGQLEALKEAAERHREEMRDKDGYLRRQSREMEGVHGELCKAKAALEQVREELHQNIQDKKLISLQLERLERESDVEMRRLQKQAALSREQVQELLQKAERDGLEAKEEAEQRALTLTAQMERSQRRHKEEMQQAAATHSSEIDAATSANAKLKHGLDSVTSETVQLRHSLVEASTERDGLRERISQMAQAFETQCATLQSLRSYIGQLSPERGEEERLAETVEKLKKEREDREETIHLLTVRLNSLNEILTLQEEKLITKTSSDPFLKKGCEGLQVLHLWREKVYALCVQLRSKDTELKAERERLLSAVKSTEQQVKQEQHRASLLQHSLDDRVAQLDLERAARERLKEDLAKAVVENGQLKSWNQQAKMDLGTLKEAFQGFSMAFEAKVADVTKSQAQLHTFSQRLTFAKRRVGTIQGLIMRRGALHKVQQATKLTAQVDDRVKNLQAELTSACEERDNLTEELKRTPELVEKALADLREQFESKLRQQRQESQQSRAEVDEAQGSLQGAREQLEESRARLEELRSQLLDQQEESQQAWQERESQIEARFSEMEAQVNTARQEHTKAVMSLRQFDRQARREREQTRAAQQLQSEQSNKELQDIRRLLKETEKDRNLLLAIVHDRGLLSEYRRARTPALQTSAALAVQPNQRPDRPSEKSCTMGAHGRLQARETLLSVLGELKTLGAAVADSAENSAEEEEDRARPSSAELC